MAGKRAQINEIFWELRNVSQKLRGLGHLIEAQDGQAVVPDDIGNANHGIALILIDLSADLKRMANKLEGTS